MTRHKHKRSRAKLLRSLYIWHRYIGLAASLFVILLALTGLALNHTEDLALDTTHVQSPTLLDWYGIRAPEQITSYRAGPNLISAVGDQLFWNDELLPGISTPLIGALEYADLIVVGIKDRLLLFTPDGKLIEELAGAAGVPTGMQAIGRNADGMLAIHTAHGYYRTDASFLKWDKSDRVDAAWVTSTVTPESLKNILHTAYRGTGLPLERVLLDLHSGRILGSWGIYLFDAAAILFLFLALSGVWLWGKRRASARVHRRRITT